jgi:hypothetical protein
MEVKDIKKVHCLFEQSGTFKNEFIKLGIPAEDYDIQNNFNQTDHVIDLFAEIDRAYDNLTRQDKTRQDKTPYSILWIQVKTLFLLFIHAFIFVPHLRWHFLCHALITGVSMICRQSIRFSSGLSTEKNSMSV